MFHYVAEIAYLHWLLSVTSGWHSVPCWVASRRSREAHDGLTCVRKLASGPSFQTRIERFVTFPDVVPAVGAR
eukprot:2472749-Amphidinium_carterae.1